MKSLLVSTLWLSVVQLSMGKNLTLHLLQNLEGAVCLDGSPPGYYMREGSGEGADKWVLHLMGGAWCSTTADCYNRSLTFLGSSKPWLQSYELHGVFSDNVTVNPDFHNWNAVYIAYCDGGSFAGDVEEPDVYNGTKIYYRGYRILKLIFHHLNEKQGLAHATDVILTGCSAGGLAVYLHADFVQTMIVSSAKYRAFADAGYFINIPDVNGSTAFKDGSLEMLKLQNIDEAIIPACRAQYGDADLWRCLFAPYIYRFIKTPIFVLNSQYDAVFLNESYHIPCMPPGCSASDRALLWHYHRVFTEQLQPVLSSPSSNGYFIDSCYIHCQSYLSDDVWTKYAISGHSIAKSFGDWYFERSSNTRLKDCPYYPCNPTCPAEKAEGDIKFDYMLPGVL